MPTDRLEDMTVNAVIARYAEAVRAFAAFGIDACCGGQKTVREAAAKHGIDLEALMTAIRAATGTPVGASLDASERR